MFRVSSETDPSQPQPSPNLEALYTEYIPYTVKQDSKQAAPEKMPGVDRDLSQAPCFMVRVLPN